MLLIVWAKLNTFFSMAEINLTTIIAQTKKSVNSTGSPWGSNLRLTFSLSMGVKSPFDLAMGVKSPFDL